ncbi:ATP-binding cassette domain-containing protein [Desulfosoma sp.]|uniref:ATP-binding cassette domain-containing protein n=1 Tax=Desulfosoma sp. TaxID=2603217 RepID=UPI00404A215C
MLSIRRLTTCFRTTAGTATAVDEVSLDVQSGQVLGIEGESGCGKTVLSLSILRLLPIPPAFFRQGQVFFQGRNLLTLSCQELRRCFRDGTASIWFVPEKLQGEGGGLQLGSRLRPRCG